MKRLHWILLIAALLLVVGCVIGPIPLELLFFLVIGWVFYLIGVLPRVTVNWPDVAIGLAALVCFALATHWFCAWLARERRRALREASADADSVTDTSLAWRWRWSAAIVLLVLLMFLAGTAMIGVVHQTAWLVTMDEPMFSTRMDAAYRNGSISNLRSLAIAVQNHESAMKKFPAGTTVDEQGRLLHGWMTRLLPFIEEEQLYQQIDHQQPWDAPANEKPLRTRIPSFMNARTDAFEDERGYPVAHYSSNVHLIGGDQSLRSSDVRDGISRTLVMGEAVANNKAWGSPTNWRDPALGLGRSPDGFGGPWSGDITIMSFLDGHVQAISNDVDPRVLRALATPAGDETINFDDLE